MKKYEKAISEYNIAKELVMRYFGNTHPLYQEVLIAQKSVKMDLKRDDDKVYELENQRFEE